MTPAPEADSNQHEFDFNALAALKIATELVLPAGGNPDADFLTLDDQIPSPPLYVSLLFNASAENVDSLLNAGTESVGDGEPLAPPAGLFESVVSSAAQSLNELPAELGLEPAIANSITDTATDEIQPLAESADQKQSASSERAPIATEHKTQIGPAVANIDSLTNNLTSETAPGESESIAADNSLTSAAAVNVGNVRTTNKSAKAIGSETPELQPAAVAGDNPSQLRLIAIRQISRPTSNATASAATDFPSLQTQDNGQIPKSPTSASVTVQTTNPAPTPHQTGSTAPISGQPDVNPIEFVDRVANSIRLVQQDGQQLRIRLSPPHLGSLHIEVTSRGGALSVRLEVQTAAAQTALMDNMPMLRDALVQSGMSLERIEVQLADPAGDDAQPRFSDDKEQQQTEQQSQQNAQQDPQEESDELDDNDNPDPTISTGLDELDIQV